MPNPFFGVAARLANRLFPQKNAPSGLRFSFPFATFATTTIENSIQLQPAGLEWITGAFIDNSQNTQQFQLLIVDTGQRITVPAYSQASVELLGLISDKVTVRGTTNGNIDISVTLTNYVPSSANSVWNTLDPNTIVGSITVNGAVTINPNSSALLDASGNTGAANTPAQIIAAGAGRKYLHIYSMLSNTSKIGVSFGTGLNVNVAGVLELVPGGSLVFDGTAVPTQAVFICSDGVNQLFTAKYV